MAIAELPVHTSTQARVSSLDGLRVREDTLFTNHKGQEKKRLRKRVERMLGELREPLSRLLEPDEVILYVAPGQSPATWVEQYVFGWYIMYLTRTALVLTNRRLLRLFTDHKSRWRHAAKAARWGDVKQARVPGFLLPRTLRMAYADGGKEVYWGLGISDARKIRLLVESLVQASAGETPGTAGIQSLCPSCAAALSPRVYQCARCRLQFKDESTLVRRSLWIPGGGYFYTGNVYLGIVDGMVELALIALLALSLWSAVAGGVVPPLEGAPAEPVSPWVHLGFIACLLAVEKLGTVHHCRRFVRDFIPARTPVPAARAPQPAPRPRAVERAPAPGVLDPAGTLR